MNKDILLELNCSNKVMDIASVRVWLKENKSNLNLLINESNCRKWSKWLENKSIHIFPCVCSIREQDCIFIETYYKLNKTIEQHNKEDYFKAIIQEYRLISNDIVQVSEWSNKYQITNSQFAFDTEITIMLKLEPYKTLKIQLDVNEFKQITELQNIFNNIEYDKTLKQNK